MKLLHTKYIKYVATGGDLDAASERKVTMNVVATEMTETIVEDKHSDAVNPENRYGIGFVPTCRFELQAPTGDDLVNVLGGTHNANIWTKTQAIRTLAKFDLRVAYYRPSDGLLILEDFTEMNIEAKIAQNSEPEKLGYLPMAFIPTANSDVTRDNSAS